MSTLCTASIGSISVAAFTAGQFTGHWLAGSIAALVGLCLVGLLSCHSSFRLLSGVPNHSGETPLASVNLNSDPVTTIKTQGRTALLLRTPVAAGIDSETHAGLWSDFRQQHALLRGGRVRVPSWIRAGEGDGEGAEMTVQVESFWIDLTPVTNEQFAQFVKAGGYENESFWRDEAKPIVNQFTNRQGTPGPQQWTKDGFPHGNERFPVVGVSWYEADAYATWAGKRLPSDPEWMKAAAWPVETENRISQWVFPWGNQMNAEQARIWRENHIGPCSVDDLEAGRNPVGVRHLVGNVWEWMFDDFGSWDPTFPFPSDSTMASIRGGAFDTFFESQANANFFSGENRRARKANIGFRCVISACDVGPKEEFCSAANRNHIEVEVVS